MKNRKATLKQVAEAAGVSQSAVSMILSGRPGVSFLPETVRRVRQAAESLGYRASSERSRFERGTIIIFVTIITGSYYTFISQAVTQKADEAGYDTVIMETHHSAEREKRLLRAARCSGAVGILFTMPPINREYAAEVAQFVPMVVVGQSGQMTGVDTISTDQYRVGWLAAEHILSLGHHSIAYINIAYNSGHHSDSQCLIGANDCIARCSDASLDIYTGEGPDTLKPGSFHETRQIAASLARQALTDRELTAFICVTDYTAYGVMDVLHEYGYRIPEDYSVCGCNNLFSSSLAGVSLTSVDRHPVETGYSAFELLQKKIGSAPGVRPISLTHVEYLSQLIIRASTGVPRKL